jgi:hypothetical protein
MGSESQLSQKKHADGDGAWVDFNCETPACFISQDVSGANEPIILYVESVSL